MAAFLALTIVPWVTADSDTRTWFGFSVVMSYPDRSSLDLSGWVIGLVFCAAIAAILLVLVASQSRVVAAGPRIAAVIGAALATVVGFAAAHSFTEGDDALHMSAGPWLFAVGAVLVSAVLLRPSLGGGQRSAGGGA
jgi:hypothetical protein